jgi:hypothetical protein
VSLRRASAPRDTLGVIRAAQRLSGIFTNLRDGRDPLTGIGPTQINLFVRENLP